MTTRSSSTTPRKAAASKSTARKSTATKTAVRQSTRGRGKAATPPTEVQDVNVTPTTATEATETFVQAMHPELDNQAVTTDDNTSPEVDQPADTDLVSQILAAITHARPHTTGGPRVTQTHQALDEATRLVRALGSDLAAALATKTGVDPEVHNQVLEALAAAKSQIGTLETVKGELHGLRTRMDRAEENKAVWETIRHQLDVLMDWHLPTGTVSTSFMGNLKFTFTEASNQATGTFDGCYGELQLSQPGTNRTPLVLDGFSELGLPTAAAVYQLCGYFGLDIGTLPASRIPKHLRPEFFRTDPVKPRASMGAAVLSALARSAMGDPVSDRSAVRGLDNEYDPGSMIARFLGESRP